MSILIEESANWIRQAKHITAFTGAGISVESGIPPFRGNNGLWNKYDPTILDLNYFYNNMEKSWLAVKEIFYDYWDKAEPNYAHNFLAELEKNYNLNSVITQNIDGLHQKAGSKKVYEFHGTLKDGVCLQCNEKFQMKDINLDVLPPKCKKCNGSIKPDFIFFGEGIPREAYKGSFDESDIADLFIIIVTTGEVMPASLVPRYAKGNGAKIIEINPERSLFTEEVTDIFLEGKAVDICKRLQKELEKNKKNRRK